MAEQGGIAGARRIARIAQGLAIVFGLAAIVSNLAYIAYASEKLTGTLGGQLTLVPGEEHGLASASAVAPGSPLARVGVTEGAKLRLDHPFDAFRYIWPGEQIGLTLLDATPRHARITVAANLPNERLRLSRLYEIDGLSALVASIVGLIILLRSGGAWPLIVLGLAFAGFDYTTYSPLQNDPRTIAVWGALDIATGIATPLLFLDFALQFYRDNVAPLARWVRPLFAFAVLVAGIVGIATYLSDFYGYLFVPVQAEFMSLAQSVLFLSAIAALIMGWRESILALRRRYAVMLIALACFILAALTKSIASLVTGIPDLLSQLPFAVQMMFELLATAAPLLFAYAVLRHKVVDIGFVVNRALVYGVVSSILLVAFGIGEWASEHFLATRNLEANALIDGGITLAIFLTFHRLRDLAERIIEGLFFHQWRENEALLRRFVKQAAFIGSKAALGNAIVAEWTRFSGGAACALYLAGANRDFVAFQGGETRIDGDDPLIVALRAHGEPVELSDTKSLLPASLALPMCHRGALTGFVLMAGKPSGDPYRPDEQELLGWATGQAGLDLQALETEQLQDDVSRLKQDCASLTAQLELVRALGLKTADTPG